jgi:hypothetical protein
MFIPAAQGCNKEQNPAKYKMSGIDVNKNSLDLKVGETGQLEASAVPAIANQPVFQWSSTNVAVATVKNGLVRAKGAGETMIIIAYNDIIKKIPVKVSAADTSKLALLYEKQMSGSNEVPELLLNDAGNYIAGGLNVTAKNKVARLNKFYAIAERKVQYTVKFSTDAQVVFKSSEGDFNAVVDIKNKRISIATSPAIEKTVAFLQGNRDYLVEIYHVYQQSKLRIIDIVSGEIAEVAGTNNGQGGVGQGVLQPGFSVGMQWDYYSFGLTGGTSMLVKKIAVYALKNNVKLLMYGDSITQPEAYFPTPDFPMAWTQQVINEMKGDAMSSGRGGARIDMLLDYIKNELPFIKAKYVMVTIGTNGGNTAAKLTALVDYIKSQGSVPILNNIPCNESGTQVAENTLIEQVRRETGIKGCRFDLATSIAGDGKQVDRSLMYWEDYTGSYGWQIYHHPNEKGGKKMFEQTRVDLPAIYQ